MENVVKNEFIEIINREFKSRTEQIINIAKEKAVGENRNAIDTLALVNQEVRSWIASINGTININDTLLTEIASLEKPFVDEAKKEVVAEIARIIGTEQTDVTKKITDYMKSLNEKGIDLDIGAKKEEKGPSASELVSEIEEPEQSFSRSEPSYESGCGIGGCSGC